MSQCRMIHRASSLQHSFQIFNPLQYHQIRMMNPHQNININISYNMGTDKIKQPLPKKVHKQPKTPVTNPHNQCDIQIKLNRKNTENNAKKSNEHKHSNQSKKSKKKNNQPARNACTPDLFLDRRLKTEGPSTDQELLSAFKKQSKTKTHNKSLQQAIGRPAPSIKKSNSQFKAPKIIKSRHVTSCSIPNWKKIPIEFNEYALTTGICPPLPKKRRAHSTFMKNDRVISKLLNMSILASELGSSQPITSERKANSSVQSRNLKEYMSTMDMHIIRSMQQDVPIFANKSQNNQNDIIRTIMRAKQISLEELTRKAITIQRVWRKKSNNSVINKYKQLFQQISQKLQKQEKISDISGIAHSPQYHQKDDEHASSIFQNEGLVSSIKKQLYTLKNTNLQSDSMDDNLQNIRWIEESEDSNGFNETQSVGLNIKKYRELVDSQLQKSGKDQKSKAKQKYKQQIQQWNNINKHITNIMNYKGSIDSQLLLDELIKQSKNNQDWIDQDFQPSEHKSPHRNHFEHQVFQPKYQHNEFLRSHEEKFKDITTIPEEQQINIKYQDSLEEEEDDQYDKIKYQPIKQDRVKAVKQDRAKVAKQDGKDSSKQPQSLHQKSKLKSIQLQGQLPSNPNNQLDQIWVSQQIMENNVVRNYLDCGLSDFGININSRIIQIPKTIKQETLLQNEYNFSSDEAIRAKFQQVNLAPIKITAENEPDIEPQYRKKLDHAQTDHLVQHIIRFLISQFASDISVILKKSSGPPLPEKRSPPQRIQGIQTNFNSIKQYLTKFREFITKQQDNLQKVVDTINKDIGPSSLQILTYLRPELQDSNIPYSMDQEDQQFDDEEGLFVIPAELFQQFQIQLEQEYRNQNQKQMGPRMKAYLSFWHRCIFESYNQCLDYQRPYGIQGKPYEWTTETKIFRQVKRQRIMDYLHRAQNRLFDMTTLVGGIIFQKSDSPFTGADLSQQQRHMMNEERLSRILATELLENEQSWINYNDEMAQLLVELSRMIEEKLFFQYGTELKKLQRRRKMIADETIIQESVVFNVDQL